MSNLNKVKQISVGNNSYDIDAKYWGNYTTDDVKTINGESIFKDDNGDNIDTCAVEVTYKELVDLRDKGQLIPGQQYRITDYVTTTVQENTQSAGHQFDIIVTADGVNILNENARACKHEGDTYFETENLEAWQLKYCIDNDGDRFAWINPQYKAEFVAIYWDEYTGEDNYDTKIEDDKIYDWEVLYDPELEENNVVIYKSTVDIYNEEGDPDYEDIFYYRGIVTVDGVEYDSWKKWEEGNGDWVYNDEESYQYALTERIVFDGEVVWPKLKIGKGVIYRMIDEWGNDCPYDFKNIMFKRWLCTDGGGVADEENGDFTAYCYTFSYEESNGNIIDVSIFGNNGYLLNDESGAPGVYRNIMSVCRAYDSTDNFKLPTQYLNNNVFFNTFGYDGSIFYGLNSNTLGNNCQSNTFGNNCYSNTFGDYCYSNTFGNDCNYNTFGNDCNYNTFGNNCYSNTFGNNCNSNTFGNNCYSNTFGNNCGSNTFGNDCGSNTFGNFCSSNTFGDYCNSNTLGNNCQSNTFGNNCNYNTFGDYCYSNTFGNNCKSNTFGNDCNSNIFGLEATSPKAYYRYITFDSGNEHIKLDCTETRSSLKYYQNVKIALGVNNTSTYKEISDPNVGQTFETVYRPANSQTITI